MFSSKESPTLSPSTFRRMRSASPLLFGTALLAVGARRANTADAASAFAQPPPSTAEFCIGRRISLRATARASVHPPASRPSRRRTDVVAAASSSDSADDDFNDDAGDFGSLGLDGDLVHACGKMGWQVPTPVQRLAIPAILDMGSDESADGKEKEVDGSGGLWCEAPTGSGKTAAFALPLLQLLLRRKRPGTVSALPFPSASRGEEEDDDGGGYVSALVLCPTRELASQTGSVFERLASLLPAGRVRVEVVHGGTSSEPQIARLAEARRAGSGVDVVVATPGRLGDVLRRAEKVDPTAAALERRILDAFEAKTSTAGGRRGSGGGEEVSLSLQDIQDLELDRVDDDGRAELDDMLRRLDYLVLDEADRLLGGAFREEVDELLSLLPSDDDAKARLLTMLFSATFPEQIEERADRVLSRLSSGSPLRVSTTAAMRQHLPEDEADGASRRQQKRTARTTGTSAVASDAAPDIELRAVRLDEGDRTKALRRLLDDDVGQTWDRVLVFVATRHAAEHVTRKLRRFDIEAAALHGKLDQGARDRRLGAFRAGKTRVLIATDLASRGIDVEGLSAVVNYDLPRSAADFTHRVGRTGRAGKRGTAVSFITAKTESHFDFIERRELRGKRMAREIWTGLEPIESTWEIESAAGREGAPGAAHSERGLAHDRVFGGVKGRKSSKKDKLREAAAREIQEKRAAS